MRSGWPSVPVTGLVGPNLFWDSFFLPSMIQRISAPKPDHGMMADPNQSQNTKVLGFFQVFDLRYEAYLYVVQLPTDSAIRVIIKIISSAPAYAISKESKRIGKWGIFR